MTTAESLLSPEAFFLGIDAGGSKTTAVIVDSQGHTCGHGQAGSANYHTVGLDNGGGSSYRGRGTGLSKRRMPDSTQRGLDWGRRSR